MANITNEQWQVLINILGAVESGGMVYGQRDYSSYAEAYTNSSAENSITIGAFQEFHWLAKGLLQDIKNQYPNVFAKYDNAGIANDLTLSSWSGYSPSRNSAKAQAIIAIISTPEGKKVQDNRFIEQMKQHVAYGENKGVTDIGGLFEVCNIAHQGGYAAVDRILAKTAKPYTADSIYAALCTDTGVNQVGMYKNRQSKVISWLKQYMPVATTTTPLPPLQTTYEITPGVTAENILNKYRSWIGLSRADGSHKPIIDAYNSYLPHPRGYAVTYTDDYCATGFCASFVLANAVDLIGGIECSVERLIEDCFKKAGIWIEQDDITPLPGDAICFYWNESRKEVDNTGWASHIGIVEYVENGIIHTIECNSTGGAVLRRTYQIGQACIRGFARPKYNTSSATVKVEEPIKETTVKPVQHVETETPKVNTNATDIYTLPLKNGSQGDEVKKMQLMLIACGYNCGGYGADGDFGNATEQSVKAFQQDNFLEIDGIYGWKTKSILEDAFQHLNVVNIPNTMYVIKYPGMLRTGASKKYDCIAKLTANTKVFPYKSKINSHDNLWYKVKVDIDGVSQKGWIVASNLKE